MRRNSWLFCRNGRHYLRARVPQDIISIIGKREIKRSLHTSDRTEALERLAPEAAEVFELFVAARRKIKVEVEKLTPDLTDSEAKRLAYLWFRRRERESAEDAFREPGSNAAVLEDARYELTILLDGPEEMVMPLVQQAVDAVLIEAGFPSKPAPQHSGPIQPVIKRRIPDVDKTSAAYRELCDKVRRGMVENVRRQQQRLQGQTATAVDPAFDPEAVKSVATGPALTQVLELWRAERKPSDKALQDRSLAVRRFQELHDDLAIDAITKTHVREFKDALLQLPARLPRKIQKLPLPKILATASGRNRPRLSPGAVIKQLGEIRALLSWAMSNGYVEHNVAAGVTVAKAKNVYEGRTAYDKNDLQVILGDVGRFRDREPAKFWLPLLAAYTGARLSELFQLTVGDVRHRDGVDLISINTESGKRVKNLSSLREVPLHPELIRCGFLEYVSSRRAAGDDQLFADPKSNNPDEASRQFSKWFTGYRRQLGISDPRKPFHSFRHTFKEACRAAGMTEEVHDALTGHSNGSVGRGYGGVPLATKAEAINRIAYDVDLSPLYP